MAKTKTVYVCSDCGQDAPKWTGKCPACGHWNTMKEMHLAPDTQQTAQTAMVRSALAGSGQREPRPVLLAEVSAEQEPRITTLDRELDRVMGGGVVPGSLTLIGGEPGIGKSTLLLQTVLHLTGRRVLYVSGEESERQIKLRADQIGRASCRERV